MRTLKIEQLWIILTNGTCAVHRCYKRNSYHSSLYAEQQTAGIIASIHMASEQMYGDGISKIKMKEKSLHYLVRESHIVVVLSSNLNKERKVQKTLERINSILEDCCDMLKSEYVNASDDDICRCGKLIDNYLGYGSYNIHSECSRVEGIPTQFAEIHRSLGKYANAYEHLNLWKQTAVS